MNEVHMQSEELTNAEQMTSLQDSRRSFIEITLPTVVVGAILLLLPVFAPTFIQALASKLLIYCVFAVSLNILWGYANMGAFGHAAFFGCGAYAVAIFATHLGWVNFWWCTLLACLFTTAVAALLGLLALRVFPVGTGAANPMYFVLVTIGFGELLSRLAIALHPLTGGTVGLANIPYPSLGFGLQLKFRSYYYLVFIVSVVCLYLMYRLVTSRFGYGLRGIRGNERRMQALGYNTWLYKYLAWIIAGLMGGVSGVLMAYFGGVVVPGNFVMSTTFIAFIGVIVGGSKSFVGPMVGIIVYVGVDYFASLYFPDRWPLVLGAIVIAAIMLVPDGAGVWLAETWRRRIRGVA